MWLGGAREHYANDRKLPWTKVQARSKVLIMTLKKKKKPWGRAQTSVCIAWINWCCLKLGLAFLSCALLTGPVASGSARPLSTWPLTFCHAPLRWPVWGPVQSGLEERLSVCESMCVWLWWGCGGMSSSVPFGVDQGIVCGLPVWSVEISWRMGLGMMVLLRASQPLSILNAHIWL